MDSHNVAFAPADDDHALRRVRSTGDIPDTSEGSSARPSRTYHPVGHLRRSEGQQSPLQPPPPAHPHMGLIIPLSPDARDTSPLGIPTDPLPRLAETPPATQPQHHQRRRPVRRGCLGALMTFLGYQGPNAAARKEVVGLVWNVSFALVQFVAITALLAFSAHHESPTKPGVSEWAACERPLGVWDSIWLVRVVLGAVLSVWGFKRDRAIRLAAAQRQRDTIDNIEAGRFGSPILPGAAGTPNSPTTPSYMRVDSSNAGNRTGASSSSNNVNLPHTLLYSRLSLFASLISLSWFLTAHILEYTSTNTCRHTSPHLWWLTFGILCILYLMILEIFLLGILVFILGPIIYIAWSLVLLCLGRHPLQNPFYIKPEIGKLPKSVVDQIPLVLYIPAPPEDSAWHIPTKGSPITTPQPIYTYPPKSPAISSQPPRRKRFAFLRRKDKGQSKGDEKGGAGKSKKGQKVKKDEERKTWEDHWEVGDYPFVRLEGNRAACAICLMDFEEPKRVEGAELPTLTSTTGPDTNTNEQEEAGTGVAPKRIDTPSGDTSNTASPNPNSTVEEVQVDEITIEDREQLQLEDAGEGAQPLRLLACGHVFHKTCLDPWLTDVSGRCPVCQRAVELPEPSKKDKRRRANTRTNSDNSNSPRSP